MISRRGKILGTFLILALAFVWNSCGTQPGCPTCGTTVKGAYGVIDIIPVPEHNPTGEPGGPFNSFDISWVDPINHLLYTSDRIGVTVDVTNTVLDEAAFTIGGQNEVTVAGNNSSSCLPGIPSIVTGMGAVRLANFGLTSPLAAAPPAGFYNELTRFGCRNGNGTGSPATFFNSFSTFFPGFGAHGGFGGFPGAQCCASRANGVNPISGPDGLLVTPDGKTLFVGSGSATVLAFDLTTSPPTVLADFPTGSSPDFDGPSGVAPCIASWNGGAGSDPTCGDDRSDEMSYGTVNGVDVLEVNNGDPGLPFITFIDVTAIVTRAAPGNATGYCLPVNPDLNYNPGVFNFATGVATGQNYPTCILGQIYYDGVTAEDATVTVDGINAASGTPCPDPSENVASGVSGTGVGAGGADVPCHHAPIVDNNTGTFITNTGTNTATSLGEIAVAGLGASAFNPFHNTFYVENLNCTVSGTTVPPQSSVAVGCLDEIDPQIGNPVGPIVIAVIPLLNCMPAGIVQGPAHDFLIGCGGHDGAQFPPLEYIIDGSTNKIVATIDQTGGTDEVWWNPGDNRYYTAGRDMPNGPVLGVIDAATRQWLVNVPTGSNSHSVAADPLNNHIFVPLQAGARCLTQSSNGCIGVYAQQ
ncbi:MAG TPA: hypothetical protein VJX29_03680 [Candidatus Acidoferrales bacterium]|nr:hypothetical protein [Candidatus Acidoferrales bacterium]